MELWPQALSGGGSAVILCRGLVTGSAPGHAHAALNRAQRSLAALNGFGQGGATTMFGARLIALRGGVGAMTPPRSAGGSCGPLLWNWTSEVLHLACRCGGPVQR